MNINKHLPELFFIILLAISALSVTINYKNNQRVSQENLAAGFVECLKFDPKETLNTKVWVKGNCAEYYNSFKDK